MARGFLSGLIWGGVVAVGAAAAVSVWVPMGPPPDAVQEVPESAAPIATALPDPATAPRGDEAVVRGAEPDGPVSPEPAPATNGMADTTSAARPEVGGTVTALTSPPVADSQSGTGADAGQDTGQDAGQDTGTNMAAADSQPDTDGASMSSDPAQPRAPQEQENRTEMPGPVGEAPATAGDTAETATQIASGQDAGNTTATNKEPDPEAAPDPDPQKDGGETANSDEPRMAALPQAGTDQAAGDDARPGTAVAPLTDRAETAAADDGEAMSRPPVSVYAQPFENPQDKPLMAIVLIDDAQSVGVEALAAFPSPITIAVDPALPDAAARMARHRAAGFEVLALANLPSEAAPQDAEMALDSILSELPETVGVLEGTGTGIQGNRALSDQVTAILRDRGYGLVTQNNGLNTVPKLAARSGVPSAVVFRDFDGQGQSATVMRRFLDQAAFRAGQIGGVVMLGRVRPQTISALLLWGLQDRASRVALAPVSAVLDQAAAADQ